MTIKKYSFLEILAYGSIHEPLWGVLNVLAWGMVAGITLDLAVYFFTFSVLFLLFTFNRRADRKEDDINLPERTAFVKELKSMDLYAAIVCCIISVLLITSTGNILAICAYLLTIFLSLIYSKKLWFIPKIKNIFLVKNIFIGIMFVLAVIIVPFLLSETTPSILIYLLSPYLFLRVVMNTIYFDTRDIEGDAAANAWTVPTLLGENKTRKILNVMNALSFLLIILVLRSAKNPYYILFVLPSLIGFVYINIPKNTFGKIIQYQLIADGADSYSYLLILAIIWAVSVG